VSAALFVSTFGRGARTILCLHGIEAHGLRFFGLARALPKVTIVAPDLRGHGNSPKVGPWTVEQHMRDLVPLLESLGPQSFILGHSYGGLIAWELARKAPDRLSGLVLVDPAIAITRELAHAGQEGSAANLRWPDRQAAFSDLLADRPPEAHWSVALDLAVATTRDADGCLRPIVAPEAVHEGWEQMTAPLQPTDYRGPTLLLEAARENGAYVSPAVVEGMLRQLGERLRHVLLDTAHTIPSDHPDLLATHVRAFMRA
jgi:lipase